MTLLARFILVAVLSFGLLGCESAPMSMQSRSDKAPLRPLQRVLIMINGDLFPDSTKQSFFMPSAEGIRKLFIENGIAAWTMEMKPQALNPIEQIAGYAKTLGATHALIYTTSKVTSLGPRNSADYRQQQRLIADYELSFSLIDMTTRRTVWKGEIRSGTDESGTDDDIRKIRDNLQAHLARARLMKPAIAGADVSKS